MRGSKEVLSRRESSECDYGREGPRLDEWGIIATLAYDAGGLKQQIYSFLVP